jgi:hypothetical protein
MGLVTLFFLLVLFAFAVLSDMQATSLLLKLHPQPRIKDFFFLFFFFGSTGLRALILLGSYPNT